MAELKRIRRPSVRSTPGPWFLSFGILKSRPADQPPELIKEDERRVERKKGKKKGDAAAR